jgi:hypothetical protein
VVLAQAEVKTLMSTIRYNLRELEEAAGDCLTATTSEGGREATARFEALMKQNNAAAQKVRARTTRKPAHAHRSVAHGDECGRLSSSRPLPL